MRRFAELFAALDRTTSTNAKVAHMAAYFEAAAPADAAWAVFFLSGRRFKRLAGWNRLAGWARAEAGVPEWLFDASSDVVGDLAETIALLVEQTAEAEDAPLHEWAARLEGLRALEEESEQRARVVGWWRSLPPGERFLLNKMMTGALRVGVSRTLVVRALAEASGLARDVLQHRLSGRWTPSAAFYAALLDPDAEQELASRPYPFYLASPLEKDPAALGAVSEWLAEWKWDGIRAQLVRRAGETHLWSRGEELITERFPEIAEAAKTLPDGTVLDGEVLCWGVEEERPMPFAVLQKRIGRTRLGPKILREAPARFLAYDLLEAGGEDIRAEAQRARRARLEAVCEGRFSVSPLVEAPSWEGLAAKRAEARG
ncbi:MAG TPA: ATP-dependent DNA ligase, partial [Polyangiaceae bacterium LLY-WYZ-15_(1-7)]|nr:ATP-dependent DNA ligase [Polyangiaceae bacterium LLY-WYZ-15_(1-7)]